MNWIHTYCLFYLLTFIPALVSNEVIGQDFFQDPIHLHTGNGLPDNKVRKTVKDHLGFTWIGTSQGLCRFDGSNFQVFTSATHDSLTLKGDLVFDLLPDSTSGKLWIATNKGLSTFDFKTNQFKNYAHSPANPFTVPDHHPVKVIRNRPGQIFISFRDRGLYRYRPGTDDFISLFCVPTSEEPDDPGCISIAALDTDPFNDSILWLGSGAGLYRYNSFTGEHQKFWFPDPDKKKEGYSNAARCLLPFPDGKIYYGVWYEGVFVLDPATGVITHFEPDCVPPGYDFGRDVIHRFYPKSPDEFYISSGKGLRVYNTRTGCISQFWRNEKNAMKWYSVDFIDENQRIWSTIPENGLRIYNPLVQQFQTIRYEDQDLELMCLTRKILEDTSRKQLYILAQSGRGLYIIDQQTWQRSVIPPPPDYYLKNEESGFLGFDMTFLENGKIFIVEDSHFFLYEPGDTHLRPFPLQPGFENPRLRKVQKDHEGLLWVTGYNLGLTRIDLSKKQLYSFSRELEQVWKGRLGGDHIEEDIHGNIWIREHNGLLIYKRKENTFVYLPYVAGSTRAFRGMGHLEADSDSPDIWIATNAPYLGYASADTPEKGMIRLFKKEDGLMGNAVYMVKLLGTQLLVFTDEAIQRFNTRTMQFEKHFYLSYGLGKYDDASRQLSSGAIAVGKRKAISLFYPEKLLTNRELPMPYLSSFKVFDKEWNIHQTYDRPDSIFLSHKQNFFSFEFSSIAYNMPSDIRYFYKLEGFDEEWKEGSQRKFAAYTNVPGGAYHFNVKAVNNEGLSLPEPYSLYIHISTVWWKTVWFWTLAGFALIGLAWLAYRYKIGQVRKEERLKNDYERKLADVEMSALRAQMNPHFIFNSLNSIEYYILNNEPEKASDYLNRFSRLIRLILQNSKNPKVPLKDDLEALRLYIEMESLRFDNLFDYEVRVQSGLDLDQFQIPPMILQPYVENAIWHGLMQKKGEKGKLELMLRQENGHILCIIKDNGIGREEARQLRSKSGTLRKSFGMRITSDRLSLLNKISKANASVQVFDLKDPAGNPAGTRVELVIPV